METFEDFGLSEPIMRAVLKEGYAVPTPIQQKAIPHIMAGKDMIGCAQTGTGKTAAFALPILHRLAETHEGTKRIRALVLTPTRELAAQVYESFITYGRNVDLKCTVVFGGVRQNPQTDALRRGVDVLVATPGRLMDLMQQGFIKLDSVEMFVLDEADRMLDMGFIDDVRRITAKLPKVRQTLLFSATMPPKVRQLANSILVDPVQVSISPEAPAADTVEQAVYFVDHEDKRDLLIHLLQDAAVTRVLVFTRTKHGADKVVRHLTRANIKAEAIHSNKSQSARTHALDAFKLGKARVLVASDIAARGLDVDDISHVINFDMPQDPEVYVHRIGRTGRAGAAGIAYTFCDSNERDVLDVIENLNQARIPTIIEHPWHSPIPKPQSKESKGSGRGKRGSPAHMRHSSSEHNPRFRSGGSESKAHQAAGRQSGKRHPDKAQSQATAAESSTGPRKQRSRRRGKRGNGQASPAN